MDDLSSTPPYINRFSIALSLVLVLFSMTSATTVVFALLAFGVGYFVAAPQISSAQTVIDLGNRIFGEDHSSSKDSASKEDKNTEKDSSADPPQKVLHCNS
jgi:hypothetical protein